MHVTNVAIKHRWKSVTGLSNTHTDVLRMKTHMQLDFTGRLVAFHWSVSFVRR